MVEFTTLHTVFATFIFKTKLCIFRSHTRAHTSARLVIFRYQISAPNKLGKI
jgi:hypothetical protein